MFLSSMAAMEGADVSDRLESAFKPALIKGWMIWPWVQLVNFKFVPLDYRVMAVNVVALGTCSLVTLFCKKRGFLKKNKKLLF